MKVKSRTLSAPSERNQIQRRDLIGFALVVVGFITFISLFIGDSGVFGSFATQLFRGLFGKAGWMAPVTFIGLGFILIRGKGYVGSSKLFVGSTLAFIALTGLFARPFEGDFFDPSIVSTTGGYCGAVVGWAFHSLLGQVAMVGLGALMCLGLVLAIDMPLHQILERIARLRSLPRQTVAKAASQAVVNPTRALRTQRLTDDSPEIQTALFEPNEAVSVGATKKAPVFRDPVNEGMKLSSDVSIPKEGYKLPALQLLNQPEPNPQRSKADMQRNIETLEGTLEQFGIDANVVEVAAGPTVTRYEIQLGPGIRVSRIVSLADNIAMDLAASQVRVEAPIPGKAAIGVEVPNTVRTPVTLRELCENKAFLDSPSKLMVALGKDVSGVNKYADLTAMPHLLIGGATNSGKSIGLSTIITSLLMRNTPKDLRLVMIDPKRVELTLFDRIPHLMCPVIKDVKEAPGVLRAVWREMDRRYDAFSEAGVKNIDGWNSKASFQERLPYIVVIIDELADLMIQAAAEVETSICRLAQLARATGIHLIIATQRPSVDVITGTIKANIASRIAFTVSSHIDSRTILDSKGAETLVGRGDMLFLPIDANKPIRIQGCYVSEQEIENICSHWRNQETPEYTLEPIEVPSDLRSGGGRADSGDSDDPVYTEAVRWVVERQQASTSMLQRKFSLGFQRASRMLDMMEERGIVGPREGAKPREVLISAGELTDSGYAQLGFVPPEERTIEF